MFNQTVIENELSKRTNRTIRFSYETYFDNFIYRKVLVDNQETPIKIHLDQLREAERRGRLEEKYNDMLQQINQYLIIKR